MPINPTPGADSLSKFIPPIKLQKEKAAFVLVISLLFILSMFSSLWEGRITGLISSEKENVLEINQVFNETGFLELNLNKINSLKASGIIANGSGRIYYQDLNNSLSLVFDSSNFVKNNKTFFEFSDICMDTCSASLSGGKLLVVLRGENASLNLHNITYVLSAQVGNIETLPIPPVYLKNSATINLFDYFKETANHNLEYSVVMPDGVRAVLFDDVLFLSERQSGVFNAQVIASNSVLTAKTPFSIFVGKENTPDSNSKIDGAIINEFLTRKKVPVIIVLKKQATQSQIKTNNKNTSTLLEKQKIEVDIVQDALINDLNSKDTIAPLNAITGAQIIDTNNTFSISKQYETMNAISAQITPEELLVLQNNPNVESVFFDFVLNVSLQDSISLIGVNDSHVLFDVSNRTITGFGQSVCVIDTGVDYSHPALGGKVLGGVDFVNSDLDAMDDNGVSHGTHVSGIVSAVAPNSGIVPVKVCDSGGGCLASNILAGIDYCVNRSVELNISVISGSLGDGGQYDVSNCPTWFDSALETANSLGIINVYASGNNGFTSGVSYPSCSPFSVSVGASDKSDNVASFSNRGSRLDVLAPGVSINSTIRGGGYGILSGTSMATPFVSGTIALLKQVSKAQQQSLGLNTTIQTLKTTGVPISDWQRINVLNAIQQLLQNTTVPSVNTTNSSSDLINKYSSPPNTPEVEIEFNEIINKTRLEQCSKFSQNFAEINSTACPELNMTAKITFHNLPFTSNIAILRNGEICPQDICTNLSIGQKISLSANQSIQGTDRISFYVSGFSNYSINGTSGFSSAAITACGRINESVTLAQNILSTSSTSGCFDFNQSNILFDCAGFNVTSNPPGLTGFNITGLSETLNNITITNCNIFNFSTSINVTNAYGINISFVNITNGTNGIRFYNVSHSIITNASIGIDNAGRNGNTISLINVTNSTISFVAVPPYGDTFSSNSFPIFNLLNSNRNYLNNNSVPSSSSNALYLERSSNNTFVGNVFISTLTSGSGKAGALVQTSSQNNTFKYNNFSAGRNIALDICVGCDNTTLIGNLATITNFAGGSSFGIASAFSLIENNSVSGISGTQLNIAGENNTIINNTANMSGSGGSSAITVSGGNNLVIKNQFYSTGGIGIEIATLTGNNNQFINNTCSSNGDSGIETTGNAKRQNNTFTGNFCQSTTYGVSLTSAENYTFTNNTFKGRVGVLIGSVNPTNTPGSRNTNFINTTVIGDTGFEINESTNITITNTNFQDTNWSIKSKWNSNISLIDNQRVTNYSFNSSKVLISMSGLASVQFLPFLIANGTNLSMDVNLTSNKVHVNTSRVPGFNVSSNITLFEVSSQLIRVAFDDLTFENCPASVCSTPVSSGSNTLFNVSHFTTFSGFVLSANMSITSPADGAVQRPNTNVNFTVTETADTNFIDQVNLSIDGTPIALTQTSANVWTGTFTMSSTTPQSLSVTAIGYNISFGSTQNVTNTITIWNLAQNSSVEQVTIRSGGGGGVVSNKKNFAAMSFVTPKTPLVMYNEDQMTALFVVRNTGKVTLNDITLDAYSDTKDLSLRLEKAKIASLAPDEETIVKLFITSHTEPAPYEITLTANAATPPITQTSKIYITLQEPGEVIKTEQMLTEMRVADDILQKNPKCIGMQEFLEQAEIALKEKQYEKARALASAAIQGCQELIAYSAELEKPAPLIDLEKLKNYLIISLAFLSVLLLIIGYSLGMIGRHEHNAQNAAKKSGKIQKTPYFEKRNVLLGKLSSALGKKRQIPLNISNKNKFKSTNLFSSKPLGKAPGAPFYLPKSKGKF